MSVNINPPVAGGVSGSQVYSGAWATRPAASAVPINAQMTVTDVGTGGYSLWFSDGTNWRPVNNKVMLWNRAQTIASPIATMAATGATIDFTLPDALTIPAGMLYAGMKVFAIVHVRRLAAAGAAGLAGVRLGNSATTINNNTFGQGTISAVVNRDLQIFGYAHVTSSSSYLASITSAPNQPGTADYLDRTTTFDTTAVQYLSVGLGSGATIDNFCVTSYAFWLEG